MSTQDKLKQCLLNFNSSEKAQHNIIEVAIKACLHAVWRQSSITQVLNFQNMVSLLTLAETLYHAASVSEAIQLMRFQQLPSLSPC